MAFYEYAPKPWVEILPSATQDIRSLVGSLVRYDGSERLTAEEVGFLKFQRLRCELNRKRRGSIEYFSIR